MISKEIKRLVIKAEMDLRDIHKVLIQIVDEMNREQENEK